MKITRVEGTLLSAPLPPEHVMRWSGGEITVGHAALVQIHTDEGLTGLGDTYAGGWFYPVAAKALLEHLPLYAAICNALRFDAAIVNLQGAAEVWAGVDVGGRRKGFYVALIDDRRLCGANPG